MITESQIRDKELGTRTGNNGVAEPSTCNSEQEREDESQVLVILNRRERMRAKYNTCISGQEKQDESQVLVVLDRRDRMRAKYL